MPFYTLVGSDGMVPLQHPRLWRPLSNQIHWVFRNKSGNIVFQFILKSLFFFSDTVFYFCGCVYVFHLLWLSKRGYVNWFFKKFMFRFKFFFLTYIKFRSMLIVSIIVSFPCLSHKMWALLIRLNLFFHSCVFGWGEYFMQNSDSTADQNHSIRKRNFYSSDSNKFRVNTLEFTACYNITNKQYITIILYLSYYFDSKMMLIRILNNI